MMVLVLLASCSLGQLAAEGAGGAPDAGTPAAPAPASAPEPDLAADPAAAWALPEMPPPPPAPPPAEAKPAAPPAPAPAARPAFVRPPGTPSWIPDSFIDDDPFLKEPVPLNQFIPATVGGGGILAGLGFYLYAHYLEEKIRSGDPAIATDQQLRDAIGVGKIHEAIGLSLVGVGSAGIAYAFYLRYFVPKEAPPVWTPKSRSKPKPKPKAEPKAQLQLQPAPGGALAGIRVEWP